MPDYTDMPDHRKTMSLPVTHVELIGRFKDKPLEFAPGEKFNSSNSDYYLLGVIIERASGKSYGDFLQENIFKPLAMTGTGYDSNSRVIKNRANGYGVQGDSLVNAAYIDMSATYAAGGIYSTVEDIFRWNQALYTEKMVSRKSLDEMFTPFKNEYGYGWNNRKKFDRQTLENDGNIGGFFASFTRFPAERMTVVVLSNTARANTRVIANDLSAIVFNAPYKIPQERKVVALDARTLEKYIGQYQQESGVVITVTIENGKLMRQIVGQPKIELLAESETEFFLKGVELPITFIIDARRRVTGHISRRAGREILATKIK
jgi:CubicO group peptidase (beta-lactamase class C family)